MQDLRKENELLKEYVNALEKENSSRNIEKDNLIKELDKLLKQNKELHSQHSSELIGQQIREMSSKDEERQKQFVELQLYNEKIEAERNSYHEEVSRLVQEMEALKKKIEMSNSTAVSNSNMEKINAELLAQVNALTQQLTKKNQQIQKLQQTQQQNLKELEDNTRVYYEQIANKKMRAMQSEFDAELAKKNQTIAKFETQVKQLQKNVNISAEIRQLKFAKIELENKVNYLERQKSSQSLKIKELEVQVIDKSASLSKNANNLIDAEKYRKLLSNKEEDLSKTNTVINVLRTDIGLLEEKVRRLEGKLEQAKNKNSQFAREMTEQKNKEIERIKQSSQLETNQLLSKIKQYEQRLPKTQEGEINKIEIENQILKRKLRELSEENKNLLKYEASVASECISDKLPNRQGYRAYNDQDNLRDIVESLRSQLSEVRMDFKRMGEQNMRMQNLISHRFYDSINMPEYDRAYQDHLEHSRHTKFIDRRFNDHPGSFEIKKSKLNDLQPQTKHHSRNSDARYQSVSMKLRAEDIQNERLNQVEEDPHPSKEGKPARTVRNREKWSNLQSKISQLRCENEELKKSMLNE